MPTGARPGKGNEVFQDIRRTGRAALAMIVGFLIFSTVGALAQSVEPVLPGHVDAAVCGDCHQDAYENWRDSHHGWAMREPDEQNVLGDFSDVQFEHKGVMSRFFTDQNRYYVETLGADGRINDFEIRYTVGVEPLQQYLIELEDGKLQTFDVAWDTENEQWFHVFPDQPNVPGDGLHWTGPYKSWQSRCAECHQTTFEKNYDPTTKSYASSWKELTVACASCHGAGEAHVEWARAPETFSAARYLGVDKIGIANPQLTENAGAEVQTCARCHSRREPFGADSPKPGEALADHYNLALLRPGLYHADGQIEDEVYVLGSFLQSKMNARGVSCSNCHEPHSAELKVQGNGLCTQCHNPAGNDDFPTLKKAEYDTVAHSNHLAGSDGALCVSCHMPEKTYMRVDPRRDHSFRVPRPDLSLKTGAPNACTTCHAGETSGWAADQVKRWFPGGRSGSPHFSEIFTDARLQPFGEETRRGLINIANDAGQPPIIRATALSHLRLNITLADLGGLIPLLQAEDPLIRAAAVQLFRGASEDLRFEHLLPMLDDPVKSVRLATIREFLDVSPDRYPAKAGQQAGAVMREYQASLLAKADMPETQLMLGGLAMTMRNFRAAEAAFREALVMDPQLQQAWLTLARIQLAQSRLPAARKTLIGALEALPDTVLFLRMLGSVSMQLRQPTAAVQVLTRAVDQLKNDPSLWVELGNAQLQAGAHLAAIKSLAKARQFEPDNLDAIYLTAHAYLASGNHDKARDFTYLLREKYPDFAIDEQLSPLLLLPDTRKK